MEFKHKDFIKNNKRSIKQFCKAETAIFASNFYTDLYNINIEEKIPDFTIEATLFSTGSVTIEKIMKLFNQEIHSNLEGMFNFIFEIVKIKELEKNWDKEYELSQKYWKMVRELEAKDIPNFNEWLMHLQKYSYKNMKGWNN